MQVQSSRVVIIGIPLVALTAVLAFFLRGPGDGGGPHSPGEAVGAGVVNGLRATASVPAPEGANASAASPVELPVPALDPWSGEFKRWETAAYRSLLDADGDPDPTLAAEAVALLPVELFTPVDEQAYDTLLNRVGELLSVFSNYDSERYAKFFADGGSVPQSERVKMYRAKLLQKMPELDDEDVSDPVDVFKLEFDYCQSIEYMNPWSGLSPDLSSITIKSSGANLSLWQDMQSLPNQGVISNHLQWDHPRTTEQIAGAEGKVTYAVVELQIQHKNSKLAFPSTFLFYWDAEAGTWQLKEGYARYGKDVKHRIQM